MTSKEALERLLMLARPCAYEVREHRNSYCDMLENTIKQDLERLEVLEKKNQELYEKVNHLKNVKNRWRRNCKFLEKENEKLKQALDILKEKPEILMIRAESFYQCDYDENYFAEYFVYDSAGDDIRTLIYITKEQYELLKEVFGNE